MGMKKSIEDFNQYTKYYLPFWPLLTRSVFDRSINDPDFDSLYIDTEQDLLVSVFISWCGVKTKWHFDHG